MKKSPFFYSLLFSILLTGCGQTGPLYLPDAPPPIHVEPEPEPESESEPQQITE